MSELILKVFSSWDLSLKRSAKLISYLVGSNMQIKTRDLSGFENLSGLSFWSSIYEFKHRLSG